MLLQGFRACGVDGGLRAYNLPWPILTSLSLPEHTCSFFSRVPRRYLGQSSALLYHFRNTPPVMSSAYNVHSAVCFG